MARKAKPPVSEDKPRDQSEDDQPKPRLKFCGNTRDTYIERAWPGKASRNGWNGHTDWY